MPAFPPPLPRHPTESSPMRYGEAGWLFAEVPGYRSTSAAYERSIERRPRQYTVRLTGREREELRNGGRGRGWVPRLWDYNEVAGWIQLFVVPGGTVKGYLWRKRTTKTPNRGMPLFDLEGKGAHDLECAFVGDERSAVIFKRIRGAVVGLAEQEFPSACYLDLETLDTIGPALNWRKLLALGPTA
jgi:hypothetical protein